MWHYGSGVATIEAGGNNHEEKGQVILMGFGFQVGDVTKPLAAVWRIADKGHIGQLGPKAADNFIMNVESRGKTLMRRKGGSYVPDAEFVF